MNEPAIIVSHGPVSDKGHERLLCKPPNGNAFWRRVRVGSPEECWPWTGAKHKQGYGLYGAGPKRAHRVAWTLVHGEIPPGLQVLHRCDNPPCVNPGHLLLGTALDNQQDKAAKGRHWQQKKTHCPQGHEFTPENTYLPPSGGRKCVQCRRDRKRAA
jgi:hypothetical protein